MALNIFSFNDTELSCVNLSKYSLFAFLISFLRFFLALWHSSFTLCLCHLAFSLMCWIAYLTSLTSFNLFSCGEFCNIWKPTVFVSNCASFIRSRSWPIASLIFFRFVFHMFHLRVFDFFVHYVCYWLWSEFESFVIIQFDILCGYRTIVMSIRVFCSPRWKLGVIDTSFIAYSFMLQK